MRRDERRSRDVQEAIETQTHARALSCSVRRLLRRWCCPRYPADVPPGATAWPEAALSSIPGKQCHGARCGRPRNKSMHGMFSLAHSLHPCSNTAPRLSYNCVYNSVLQWSMTRIASNLASTPAAPFIPSPHWDSQASGGVLAGRERASAVFLEIPVMSVRFSG